VCSSDLDVDGNLAGFVMVFNHRNEGDPETDYQIAEFFVIYKYRRSGVGKQAFFQVLDKHKGRWGLGTHPKNVTAMKFWENSICEYTKGKYESIKSNSNAYPDGSHINLFYFDNGQHS
jgi:predicted acetyltransferase